MTTSTSTKSTEHILTSDAADRAMQIEPPELSTRLAAGETIHLLDIRTREEFDAVKLPGAQLFTQEFMQEILAQWSRDRSSRDLRSPRHAQHGRRSVFSGTRL